MTIGHRPVLAVLLGALTLAVSPAALGDEATFQLVSPSSGSGCVGFIVETIGGTVSGCTARPAGVGMINTEYSAAANGSTVFFADDNQDPSDGSELLYLKVVDDNGSPGIFSYLIGVDGTNRHQVFLSSSGSPYGAFVPTATPVSPPALVDMTHITVPSVVGLDVPTATSHLAADNLTVGAVSYAYSTTIAKDRVVSQSPNAGDVAHRTAKQGPPVDLVVSSGPAPCVVPKVKGKSLSAAKRAITARNCEVGKISHAFSRTVKKGRVVSTRPGAGKHLSPQAKVALILSKGKKS